MSTVLNVEKGEVAKRNEQHEYPSLTSNSKFVLSKRILLKDQHGNIVEDFDGLCRRVARTVIQTGVTEDELFNLLRSLDFLPNSPCLVNAGKSGMTLSACYVLPADDSIESIFDTVKYAALIHKQGGGTGVSGSKIRPRGFTVGSTGGVASGPVSLLFQVMNDATEQIKQGSTRRGANMGILPIDHPEILHFIRYKLEDGKLKNFNISVAVTNVFMQELKSEPDGAHICHFNGKNFYVSQDATSHENIPSDPVTRRQLWSEIIKNAHKNGEPGLFFIDQANEKNAALTDPKDTSNAAYINSTNPCQPGWATILTPTGISTLEKLKVGDIIWSGYNWTKVIRKEMTGIKPVYAYRTRAGSFYGTENHKVVSFGEKVEVKDAEAVDISTNKDVLITPIDLQDVMDGLVLGDGSVHKASGNLVLLIIGDKDDITRSEIEPYLVEPRFGIKDKWWAVHTTIKPEELPKTYLRQIPDRFKFGSPSKVRGFLRGLYSANGSIVGYRITLKASSFTVIETVQEMLSSIGIASYYTTNKSCEVKFGNGTYQCRESYDLNIGTVEGRRLFKELIGFVHENKQQRLNTVCNIQPGSKPSKSTFEIVEKEYVCEEPVFDITVESEEHTYWTGGLFVSNCGEQALSDYDACCLGSINLSNFVHTNGTFNVDWKRLESVVRLAIHFLNGVIDLEAHPLNQIKETVRRNRKIGLGVMGYADLLAKLGLDYNDKESWRFGETIAVFIKDIAWDESFKIAKERGKSYPAFDHAAWLRVHPELAEKFMKYEIGPANMEVTSVAPTGTISMIAGCSNGIEPILSWAFVQRRIDTITTQVHPLVENVLGYDIVTDLRVKAAELYPGNAMLQVRWLNEQLIPLMKSHGNGFTIARDVSVEAHLQHQLAWSQHVDSGISKTINFLSSAIESDVEKAYNFAWKNGFKGITVYREGSRNDEVISTGLDAVETDKKTLNGRPTVLPGVIIRSRVEVEPGHYENVYVSVGLKGAKISGGTPYEVFLAGDPKQDQYTAQMIDSVTRMSSTALRYGTPPNVVAQQLERIRSQHVFSMPLRIAQAIHTAMALSDDIPLKHKEIIDKCQQTINGSVCNGTLIFNEGCYKCEKCYFSKCG